MEKMEKILLEDEVKVKQDDPLVGRSKNLIFKPLSDRQVIEKNLKDYKPFGEKWRRNRKDAINSEDGNLPDRSEGD